VKFSYRESLFRKLGVAATADASAGEGSERARIETVEL